MDESLLGFVTRALSVTVVVQLQQGLALGGVKTGAPVAIATSLTGEREIAGIAALFKTTAAEISKRTYAGGSAGPNRRELIDFFGVTIRAHYREAKIRRVSPRALEIAPYHRAVWELRPLSFDPQTRISRASITKKAIIAFVGPTRLGMYIYHHGTTAERDA